MKRIVSTLLTMAVLSACYKTPPPCDPSTIDYPRCLDPTQPSLNGKPGNALGASLIYPGQTTRSTSIVDSTAIGRSILTAASASAILSILGVSNLDSWENRAVAHANSVVTFRAAHHTWFGSVVPKLGTLGSDWTALFSGSGATTIVQSGEEGGCSQITTGATASSGVEGISVVNGLGSYGASYISDLTAAAGKWHVTWDWKLTTVPDAQAEFVTGWATPAGVPIIGVGVRGAQSTGFYRLFVAGTATGQTGTVARDTKRHRAEFWHDGSVAAGTINWTIDDVAQTAVTGYSAGAPGAPYFRIINGSTAAAQTAIICQYGYQGDGVQIPPP